MAQTNLGRIAMLYRGIYDPARAYVALDIIYSAGSTYLCTAPCQGVMPPNIANWQLMAPSPALEDKQAAEAAAQSAQSAKTAAAGSASAAESAKTAAAGSASAAESAKTAAAGSASAAESAKTAAAGSATQAANSATAAEQAAASVPTIDAFYPVGIIIELNVSTSPATLFPGTTWMPFGTGRVTVGIDPSDTDFDTLGKTGGEKEHALLSNEGPEHSHAINARSNPSTFGAWGAAAFPSNTGTNTTMNTQASGGGAPHNNLQPYIVVYRWARTA